MYKRFLPTLITVASLLVVAASVGWLFVTFWKDAAAGDFGTLAFVGVFVGVGIALGLRNRRRMNSAPLAQTRAKLAEQLCAPFESPLVPHRAHFRASVQALAHAVFGETREAQACLDTVSWRDLPAVLEAVGYQTRAALSYLEERDVQRGRADAARAERLLAAPQLQFGRARDKRLARFYVAWGDVLTGAANQVDLRELEAMQTDGNPLLRALATTALARALAERGDTVRLATVQGELARMAPHARALLAHAGVLAPSDSTVATGAGELLPCARCGHFVSPPAVRQAHARHYCEDCAARLVQQARALAVHAERARGFSFLPFGAAATICVMAVGGVVVHVQNGALGHAVSSLAVCGLFSWLCVEAGLALRRGHRPGGFGRLAWGLCLLLVPLGTFLTLYALVSLRPNVMRQLEQEEYLDGVFLGGIVPRTPRLLGTLSAVGALLGLAFAVFGQLG